LVFLWSLAFVLDLSFARERLKPKGKRKTKGKKTACRLDKVVFSLKLKTKKNWNRRERVLPAAKLFGIPPVTVLPSFDL
jgi:hypothetical protein